MNGCVGRSPLFTAFEKPEAAAQENTYAACERAVAVDAQPTAVVVQKEKELVASVGRRTHISQKMPEQGYYIIARPLLCDIRCYA